MRSPATGHDLLKASCAACYEAPAVRALFGDSLHPGGLRTTDALGRRLRLRSGDHVLDVACGPGVTADYLGGRFGCRVTGVEYSVKTADEAQRRTAGRIAVAAGDGERLPFRDSTFDAVVIECSLSLLPEKPAAVDEMARVLRPGGRIGITDFAIERPLPSELPDVLERLGCISGAVTAGRYLELLRSGGFAEITLHDLRWALTDLVERAGRMLLLVEMAAGLGKWTGLPVAPAQLHGWLREARRWIARGTRATSCSRQSNR